MEAFGIRRRLQANMIFLLVAEHPILLVSTL
jgi:hypothetical protein